MWLSKGERAVLVPEAMVDTIKRCLSDGWVEIADPRGVLLPTSEMANEAQPPIESDAPPAPAPEQPPLRHQSHQRGRR